MGIEKYLSEIKSELMDGKYKPSPVKRVMIPKPDGSERPLGIPTVKDRIVQMATKIAIEPVFEADFRDCSYGFRPKRSAKQALEVVRKACNNKGYYVVDADIEKFFDNVNQDKLMKLVEQRISDRRILKLIRQWLVSGVLYGNVLTISELGTSQGSVISPLLANIYLNTLDRLWEKYGLTHGILVRYADDTVIICKNKKSAKHALNLLRYIMGKLDLKLHPVKTKIVSMWDGREGFDFLGMHHRRMTTETSKGQLYKETYQYPKMCIRDRGMEVYSRIFGENCMYHVRPYDGVVQMLDSLKKKGIKIAVFSNKPHLQAIDVVESTFGKGSFDPIQGLSLIHI